jgi:hypothetical protein
MLQSDELAKNNSGPDGAKPTRTSTALDETSVYPRLPLNGICLMIKRQVINEVGYSDNKASVGDWSDGETDYCSRAGRAGWKLALTDVQGLTSSLKKVTIELIVSFHTLMKYDDRRIEKSGGR